ncbi:hypothetical protein, partial [Serratia grimesii]
STGTRSENEKRGNSAPVKVNSFRFIPVIGGGNKKYRFWFSSKEEGLATIHLFATGMQNDVELHILNITPIQSGDGSYIKNGGIVLNVGKDKRTCLELTLSENYFGPIEVKQSQLEKGFGNEN